jgi:hypothetical protein
MLKIITKTAVIALATLALAGCATPAGPAARDAADESTPSAFPGARAAGLAPQGDEAGKPANSPTRISGAKLIEQGKVLRLYMPGVATGDTVGVRYVPIGAKDVWNVKPVGYGIATHRDGDTFTIENYVPIPAGTYHILMVDSSQRYANLIGSVDGK